MKTMQLESTGVLWRLATFYGPLDASYTQKYGTDICSYTQACLKGAGRALLACVACMFVALLLADAGAYWVVALMMGVLYEPDPAAIFGTMLVVVPPCALGTITLISAVKERLEERRWSQEQKEPSALSTMYDAWKNKYCHKVEFKD